MPGATLGDFLLHCFQGSYRLPEAELLLITRPGVDDPQIWKLLTSGLPFEITTHTLFETYAAANTAKNNYIAAKASGALELSLNGTAVEDYVFKVLEVDANPIAIGLGAIAGDTTLYYGLLTARWKLLALPAPA